MDLVSHLTVLVGFGCVAVCLGSECKVQVPGRGVWIESLRELHTGEARRLTAVFCTMDPLDLQPDEYIKISSIYRLGLAPIITANSQISVRKSFSSSFVQLISTTADGPYRMNTKYIFDEIKYPGFFVADFCDSTGCPRLESSQEHTTQKVPLTCKMWYTQGRVKLEQHRSMMTGVAKAIRTHFCDLSPVNVQLWEANVDDSEKYQLIWQKVIHPVLSDGIETIPVTMDTNISVPHKFSSKYSANMLTSGGSTATLCDHLVFGDVPYPSEFILSFCYDSACQQRVSDSDELEAVSCPKTTIENSITRDPTSRYPKQSVMTSTAPSVNRLFYLWFVSALWPLAIITL
ncbi:hypothetical protein LSH36_5g18085 [Paralvinella palmiformis]|uniref:Uncharacterized protein n=1 Tax=Paralvinella palmiformis TaxID=53620 RepID=A0AAD9KF52_9ANNE|nr:hypothetical protein LSH36_5g18085 [Paralvinella palmiformis]